MPTLRNRLFFDIAKNLRAFLNVDAGLVHGPVPSTAQQVEAQAQERARKQQAKKIKQIRHWLRNKDRKLKKLQEELSKERQRADVLQTAPDDESVRRYVLDNYGHEHGLPVVDLSDVLPGFEETVSTRGSAGDQIGLGDMAFLKGLAKKPSGCKYLEFGLWRGDSVSNLAGVADECFSINLPTEALENLDSSDAFVVERASRNGDTDVMYNSHVFDRADLERRFDLVFVNGHRSRRSVKLATESAFDLLKDAASTVVWYGYKSSSGGIDWRVFAGILDGCPDDKLDNLYHVSGTSCVMYSDGAFPRRNVEDHRLFGKVLDVKVTARDVARKLVILDDTFPNLQSSFRIAEYNAYLERWKDATAYSTAENRVSLREERSFEQVLGEYAALYPELGSRIFKFGEQIDLRGDLAYFVFLNNAALFLDAIDKHDVPFAFTLYPGGGFKLDQKDSDNKLRRTFSSPNFKKVISTQRITSEYLMDQGFCDPDKIEFVYGGVFPLANLASQAPPKSYYKENKDTFDVCFVAYKYTEQSIVSKGYDVFVEVAKRLSKTHDDVRFHVVGTFDESDIDVSDIGSKIRFYGPQTSGFFPAFYSRMDIILSPNVPFALLPGAFDGFPTGSCMEAGLCGVAVLCADPLDLNVAFKDGEEMVVIPHDADAISATIAWYHDRYDDLYLLAQRGQEAFAGVFSMEAQMEPRLRVLSELLGENYLANKR